MTFNKFIQSEYSKFTEENSKSLIKSYQDKANDLINPDKTLNFKSKYMFEFKNTFNNFVGFNEDEFYNFILGISQSTTFTKIVFNKKFKIREQVKTHQKLIIKYFKHNNILNKLTTHTPQKVENPSPSRGFSQLPFYLNGKPIYFYIIPTSQSLTHTEAQTRLSKSHLYVNKGYGIFDDSTEDNLED